MTLTAISSSGRRGLIATQKPPGRRTTYAEMLRRILTSRRRTTLCCQMLAPLSSLRVAKIAPRSCTPGAAAAVEACLHRDPGEIGLLLQALQPREQLIHRLARA